MNAPSAAHLGQGQKKADVREHPRVFPHVGLLFIEPPGQRLNEAGRAALYLIIRHVISRLATARRAFHSPTSPDTASFYQMRRRKQGYFLLKESFFSFGN